MAATTQQERVSVADPAAAARIMDSVDTLVADCDGVLWRGSDTIANAPEALLALRQAGKRLLFVTNNSSKSRAKYVDKFAGLGIKVEPEEIVSSSYAAAAYLKSIGFSKKALLLAPPGVEEEMALAGINIVRAADLNLPVYETVESMLEIKPDPEIGAVVVGWDPHFSYSRLVYASVCLRELSGCMFVATNLDDADSIGRGRMMPGTGGLVAAVASASGVEPFNVGKGGSWLLPYLCQHYRLDPARSCIIGDRLDTDIALGKEGGLVTVLPLTGVTSLRDLVAAPPSVLPDFVIPSVAALAGL